MPRQKHQRMTVPSDHREAMDALAAARRAGEITMDEYLARTRRIIISGKAVDNIGTRKARM
jgi:hypothetical protein